MCLASLLRWPTVVSLLVVCAPCTYPDGGFAGKGSPEARSAIDSPGQRAAVIRRADRGEMLVLQPAYRGPATDFAWIIPLPHRPMNPENDLGLADASFLIALLSASEAEFVTHIRAPLPGRRKPEPPPPPGPPSAPGVGPPPGAAGGPPGVTVHAAVNVGKYRATVLSATGGGVLERWLDSNGYRLPGEPAPILQSYVERKWCFVALKLRAPYRTGSVRAMDLEPLAITFPLDRDEPLVYPMMLTRLSAAPTFRLELAVLDADEQACRNLPTIWPREGLTLPPGWTYGEWRRWVAETHPKGALVRESVLRYAHLDATQYSYAEPGQIDPRSVVDRDYAVCSRFSALLPRETMTDLKFAWDPEARDYYRGRDCYRGLVSRTAWGPAPVWAWLVDPRVLTALLALVALALLTRRWCRPRPETVGPLVPWAAVALNLTPIAATVATVLIVGTGTHLLDRLDDRRDGPWLLGWIAVMQVLFLLVVGVATGALSSAEPRKRPVWLWVLATVLGLAGAAFMMIGLGTWEDWGRAMPWVVGAGGVAAVLWGGLCVANLVSSAWLIARRFRWRTERPLWLLEGEILACLGVIALANWGGWVLRGEYYTSPAQQYDRAQGRLSSSRLHQFTERTGGYPVSVEQLTQAGRAEEVLDAAGARRRLEAPVKLPPKLDRPLLDPLTGRADSWAVDPFDPETITSRALRVRISAKRQWPR